MREISRQRILWAEWQGRAGQGLRMWRCQPCRCGLAASSMWQAVPAPVAFCGRRTLAGCFYASSLCFDSSQRYERGLKESALFRFACGLFCLTSIQRFFGLNLGHDGDITVGYRAGRHIFT